MPINTGLNTHTNRLEYVNSNPFIYYYSFFFVKSQRNTCSKQTATSFGSILAIEP